MPNAKILAEKQAAVQALTEKMKGAVSGVFVDYKGINVEEDTALRKECRESDVDYSVVKNTMLRFAVDSLGYNELDSILNGTTSLAISAGDAIAPARIMKTYSDKLGDRFEIKGGFVEGKVMSVDELKSLGQLTSKNDLYAQVLGTMLAPITSLAIVIKAIAEQKGAAAE